jgi:hypothetical protein
LNLFTPEKQSALYTTFCEAQLLPMEQSMNTRKEQQELAPENPSVLDKNTQFVRKHEVGIFEGKGESSKRQVGQSAATLGRHVKSAKSGAEVSADRAKEVKSVRAKREKEAFGS